MLGNLFKSKTKKYQEELYISNGYTDERGVWWPPIINGVPIPYGLSTQALIDQMHVSMADYAVVCTALAHKRDRNASKVLLDQLKNKDYYKRRLALDNIQMSIYWKESVECLKELLYDRNVYIVRTALRGILINRIENCEEDVALIAEIWDKDEDVLYYTQEILKDYALNRTGVWHIEDSKRFMRKKESLVFRGASQQKPVQYTNDYVDIVKKYFPDYSENQVKDLLHQLAREGCGYAALILVLYKRYWHTRDEFERVFGLPMFNGLGEMSYNELMVDFYCMTDEPGIGMTLIQAKQRWEKFCKYYGLVLPLKIDISITPDNYWKEAKSGDVIILANYFTMYDKWNEPVQVRGAHYMNLREIDIDGTYVVTSWGNNYYLKPEDIIEGVWFLKVAY